MTVQLTVPDMACAACSETIAKAIQSLDAGAIVQADPKTKLVQIETQMTEADIKNAVIAAGYNPT